MTDNHMEELREKVDTILQQTLPLICSHCSGGGSNSVEGKGTENCPECGGSGLKGFTNDYAIGLMLDCIQSEVLAVLDEIMEAGNSKRAAIDKLRTRYGGKE